jgi:hypothetical protein
MAGILDSYGALAVMAGQFRPVSGSAGTFAVSTAAAATIPYKTLSAWKATHILLTCGVAANWTLCGEAAGSPAGFGGHQMNAGDLYIFSMEQAQTLQITAQTTSGSAYASPVSLL